MKYTQLFEIHLQRKGEPPAPIAVEALDLQPTLSDPAGLRALQRHRLLTLPQSDGLVVLMGHSDGGRSCIEFADLTLRFELSIRDPTVAYDLDLTPMGSFKQPTFRNVQGRVELELGELQSPSDALPSAPLELNTPEAALGSQKKLAWVEIHSVDSSWRDAPRRFVLSLQPRPVFWIYYVLIKHFDKNKLPHITDSNRARAFDFEGTPLPADSALTAQDLVARNLVAENPDVPVYRFCSKTFPPLSGGSLTGLTLMLDDKKLISHLPPPPSQQMMKLSAQGSSPQEALYRVITL